MNFKSMQIGHYMNMIGNSINSVQSGILTFYDSPNVLVKFFTMFDWYRGFSVFCTKNNLIENLTMTAHSFKFKWLTTFNPFRVTSNI